MQYPEAFRVCCEYLRLVQTCPMNRIVEEWDLFVQKINELDIHEEDKKAIQLMNLDIQNPQRSDRVAQRVLHPYEIDHLAPDAYGSLHEVEDLRIFSPEKVDHLIEQVLQTGSGIVSKEEIDDVILSHWTKAIARLRGLKEN